MQKQAWSSRLSFSWVVCLVHLFDLVYFVIWLIWFIWISFVQPKNKADQTNQATAFLRCYRFNPDFSSIPATSSDPLAWRGFSRSASSTDCQYASVGLTCEKPQRASVSNASDGIHE